MIKASSYEKESRDRPESGYNVVELTVIVAIAAIILSMSLIIFGKARNHYRLVQNAERLVWQIERARSLAIKYNQTLTLGFASQNTVFGLTCANCAGAASELPPLSVPAGITLSAYPTMTIRGNGTIQSTSPAIVIGDGQGRQVPITIANSGRTTIGDVSEAAASH